MSRVARVVLQGFPQHVGKRGNRSEDVFETDGDREAYLRFLLKSGERRDLAAWAYCLMTNHILPVPLWEDSLGLALRDAHAVVRAHVAEERPAGRRAFVGGSTLRRVKSRSGGSRRTGGGLPPVERATALQRGPCRGSGAGVPTGGHVFRLGQVARAGRQRGAQRSAVQHLDRTALRFEDLSDIALRTSE